MYMFNHLSCEIDVTDSSLDSHERYHLMISYLKMLVNAMENNQVSKFTAKDDVGNMTVELSHKIHNF